MPSRKASIVQPAPPFGAVFFIFLLSDSGAAKEVVSLACSDREKTRIDRRR
jgi:hypothetical protein